MSAQSHRSDPQVLNRRTLKRDHRRLAAMLAPGMSVLDVGCGTGAITAGIARAAAPGEVVGIDRDAALLDMARAEHSAIPNLSFEQRDALSMEFGARFDIVTAARSLQWIADPGRAVRRMALAAKPGGRVVALDYNHRRNAWAPEPPPEFAEFYDAFLAWRAANHWDNDIAERLPGMFLSAGIADIRVTPADEVAERGGPEFAASAAIWSRVIASVGPQIVASGFLMEQQRLRAAEAYSAYIDTRLQKQTPSMRAIVGTKP